MKTLEEIRAKKVEDDEKMHALESKYSDLRDALKKLYHLKFLIKKECEPPADIISRIETLEVEKKKVAEQLEDLKDEFMFLDNNEKYVFGRQYLPAALAILSKYSGKKYGEKTKEKISAEMEEQTGGRLWIPQNGHELYISNDLPERPNFGVTCRTMSGRQFLNVENKIQAVPLEEILVKNGENYIEDIPKRVRELKKARTKVSDAEARLEIAIKNYNNLLVGNMEEYF